jgi:hypothetical protein
MAQAGIEALLWDNRANSKLPNPGLTLTIPSSDVYFYQEWRRVRLPVLEDANSLAFEEAIAICVGDPLKDRQEYGYSSLNFKFDIDQFETLPGRLDRLAALKGYLPNKN